VELFADAAVRQIDPVRVASAEYSAPNNQKRIISLSLSPFFSFKEINKITVSLGAVIGRSVESPARYTL